MGVWTLKKFNTLPLICNGPLKFFLCDPHGRLTSPLFPRKTASVDTGEPKNFNIYIYVCGGVCVCVCGSGTFRSSLFYVGPIIHKLYIHPNII